MLKKINFQLLLLSFFFQIICHSIYASNECDLSIVGFINSSDGIGRIPLLIIDCLKDCDVNLNFITTREKNYISRETPLNIQRLLRNKNLEGKITLFTELISYNNNPSPDLVIPKSSLIKIAYSMLEATKIPQSWVEKINKTFDAVVVPDEFLIDVYKNSGVKVPIFALPIVLNLEDFFNVDTKGAQNMPFVFGNSCAVEKRKNYLKLIEAFYKAFGNSSKVLLKINGRRSNPEEFRKIKDKIHELNTKNIEFKIGVLSNKEYLKFMSGLDCFVSLSLGEGFAIPPREALALGIPVVITDNTAHSTICKTGFVKSIPSNNLVPSIYSIFQNKQIGHSFDCNIDDAAKALKDVYENYLIYLQKAKLGRQWVKKYLKNNLGKKYLNLVKPKSVILGDQNIITDDYIMTNSKFLYEKYKKIIDDNFNKKFEQKAINSIRNIYYLNYLTLKNLIKNNEQFLPFWNLFLRRNYFGSSENINIDFDLSMRYGFYKRNNQIKYDEYEIMDNLKLFKKIFNKNINIRATLNSKIPKIIHQIWLGGKFPNQFKKITDTWLKMHPDWKYYLWTDDNIKELYPLYNQKYFDEETNLAQKTEILRYEILYRFGGVYVDTDYECIKNFDELVNKYNFFVGIQPYDAAPYFLEISIIGSSQNHPIMKHAVETIEYSRNERMPLYRTGPGHITKSFKFITQFNDDSVMIFPVSVLYPLGFLDRNKRIDPICFLGKESYGIHYWSGTWYLQH